MSNKQSKSTAKEAAENFKDAPAPMSQNPDPAKAIEPKPAGEQPSEPTDKVAKDEVQATLKTAAANLPVDPKSGDVQKQLAELAKSGKGSPKAALVEAFESVALVVGADKAKRILVDEYGTEDPRKLKSSQLLDAVDALYGA